MMESPLLITNLLTRAQTFYARKQIVSRTSTQGQLFRYTYADLAARVGRLANVLASFGVRRGDRVATLAWNQHRHLEAYFAIPCMGAVLHTVNVRLFPEQLVYIINHAEDKVLLIDEDLVPIVEKLQDQLRTVQTYIIMTDQPTLPATSLSPAYSYEALLAEVDVAFHYPSDLEENSAAGICYTSGTTGNPKGVVFTHRSTILHAMSLGHADALALSERDTVLTVVPMFHVNAWGLPLAGAMYGYQQVLPGPAATAGVLAELLEQERVTVSAGVPTVWLGVARELEQHPRHLALRLVVCGGSAAPTSLIQTYEAKLGVQFLHAYGMTETSPLATVARLRSHQEHLTGDARLAVLARQGTPVPGIEVRVVNDAGDVPCDDATMGEVWMRGGWVADEYYRDPRSAETFVDGWLHSGDVATIDSDGAIKIVDRTKDVVKSGGEWISTVDLENALMGHPQVFEATVVGVPHPRWDERPLAFVVPKDARLSAADKAQLATELRTLLSSSFAKWQLPDDILFVPDIPKTSVGKFLKRALRDEYQHYFTNV